MARIKIKPVEPLELEMTDGTVKVALFNNCAFATFEDEFGSIEKLAMGEGQKAPFDFVAKLLYCGVRVTEPEFSLREAKTITLMGGADLITAVLDAVFQNVTAGMDEEKLGNFYQEVNRRIENIIEKA